jgi:hypothetical protein
MGKGTLLVVQDLGLCLQTRPTQPLISWCSCLARATELLSYPRGRCGVCLRSPSVRKEKTPPGLSLSCCCRFHSTCKSWGRVGGLVADPRRPDGGVTRRS